MTKNKKFKLISLTTVLGLSTVATVALATSLSCQQLTTVQKNNTKDSQILNKTSYCNVKFSKPTNFPTLTYEGQTRIEIKSGYPFGTIVKPRPILKGYVVSSWYTLDGTGTKVPMTDTTKIENDINIYPEMVLDGKPITVSGESIIYDGLNKTYTYNVKNKDGTEIVDPSHLTWELSEPEYAVITPIPGSASCNVTPNFTEEPRNVTLTVTYGTGAAAPTDSIEITIYPPYYLADYEIEVQNPLTTEYEAINLGKVYWFVTQSNGSQWQAFPDDGNVTHDVKEEDNEKYWYITFGNYGPESGTIERDSEDWKPTHYSDVYPGSQIYSIGDCFMEETDYFDCELHGGVNAITKEPKIIGTIGNSFLYGCERFNQNINDIFTFPSHALFTIGDDFLSACTAFNNGEDSGTDSGLILPNAQWYGDYFMNDCTSLEGEITIQTSLTHIGSFFMNNTHISKATIPAGFSSDVDDTIVYGWFLTDCYYLRNVVIETDSISYFNEISGGTPEDHRGSFVVYQPYSDSEGITITASSAVCDELEYYFPNGSYTDGGGQSYYRNLIFNPIP